MVAPRLQNAVCIQNDDVSSNAYLRQNKHAMGVSKEASICNK